MQKLGNDELCQVVISVDLGTSLDTGNSFLNKPWNYVDGVNPQLPSFPALEWINKYGSFHVYRSLIVE
jgi:hypothetical protein